ncbi:MAG TPA: TlpA disulfide reductase family protein, partial [Bryobacteraceae bacterium]|nr:TlpA disulfide reductase family protein [Bryobacteraceae bacterium]
MRNLLVGLLACAIAFGATVPRPSPEYIINLPTGQKQSVLKQKGKVVVVAFISTTCPHCQNSSKVLSRLHAEYAAKGLEVLGVAIDDGADAAAFARKFNVSFPVGTASRES